MVLDYSERRPVTKNRPRRQVGGIFLALAGAVVVAYALGVLTGWFLFRSAAHLPVAQVQGTATGNQKAAAAGGQPAQTPQTPSAAGPQEPALTFYETLPKGSKAVIGSGLNPQKAAEGTPAKHPPAPAPVAQVPQSPAKPAPSAEPAGQPKETPKAPAKAPEAPVRDVAARPADAKGKFLVQVASCRTRKEAEAAVARLTAAGLAAYIVESSLAEKGVWYRVRIGKHLDQQAAQDMAARAGKGSIVIPE